MNRKLSAKWIWHKDSDANPYNETIIARRVFEVRKNVLDASVRITADSFYRLFINDRWICDGPCRAWPEHYRFDTIDVASYLCKGKNKIEIVARYYGTGTFHTIPQRPGLLAQLDVRFDDRTRVILATDETWQTSIAEPWIKNTPKISIQMEPFEYYDARLETNINFTDAAVVCQACGGPWKQLKQRDVKLLNRESVSFKKIKSVNLISPFEYDIFCIPTIRLIYPDLIEANANITDPCGIAALLQIERDIEISVIEDDFKCAIDGRRSTTGNYRLAAGTHLVAAFVNTIIGNKKEKRIMIKGLSSAKLFNLLDRQYGNPWSFVVFDQFAVAENDFVFRDFFQNTPRINNLLKEYEQLTTDLLAMTADVELFRKNIIRQTRNIPSETLFVSDFSPLFELRQIKNENPDCLENPEAMLQNNMQSATLSPTNDDSLEICLDLGRQSVGYYTVDLTADEGVIVDINGIEYIRPDDIVQHTIKNRNGLRYITKKGRNQFTSLKRRSGRYIFLTFRNVTKNIQIHHVGHIESTYPTEPVPHFVCNDERLNRIWMISAHTLKLCMEDVYTDCPLYEQTLWIGDARNESLYGYYTFGAVDIAEKCIRLGAESLNRFPIVGSQVPSSWTCLLPVWSFLWTISVFEYYWFTGNKDFLREMFPYIIKNLSGARKYIDRRGLFTATFWNFFDWVKTETCQQTMLFNSMFFVGAVNAAINSAAVLDKTDEIKHLYKLRAKIKRSINTFWLQDRRSYPDAVQADGLPGTIISQHTSFLAILYDIIKPDYAKYAIQNLLNPPPDMVKVGSPFAMMFLYEALEKMKMQDTIIDSIREKYSPMIDSGASTVWESFADSSISQDLFPTRSHCHGWSCLPLYFLPRIVLGIRQTSPGGNSFCIEPATCGLQQAAGTIQTAKGALTVQWYIEKDIVYVNVQKPKDVEINVTKNKMTRQLKFRYTIQTSHHGQ